MQNKTIEQLRADLASMKDAQAQTTSPDRRKIYTATISKIEALINDRETKSGSTTNEKSNVVLESNSRPTSAKLSAAKSASAKHDGALRKGASHTIKADPIRHTASEISVNTGTGYPVITVNWDDGYSFTGNESAMRSRFTGCLSDITRYSCVRSGRIERIWEKKQPHRAVGYYAALTHFYAGHQPSMLQIGRVRPSDATRVIFELIKSKATKP